MTEEEIMIASEGGKTGSGRNSFTRNVLYFYITEEPVILIYERELNSQREAELSVNIDFESNQISPDDNRIV